MIKKQILKIQKMPIIFIWALTIILFVLTTGFLSSKYFNNLAKEDETNNLIKQSLLISSVVKTDELASLNGEIADTLNPNYGKIKSQFESFCNQLSSIRYIYLVGKKKDKLFFYVDSESEQNKLKSIRSTATPGELYLDAPKEMVSMFNKKTPQAIEPYSDQWGEFRTVLIPIINKRNQVVAIMGLDMDISYWNKLLMTKRLFPFAVSAIFILLVIGVSIFLKTRTDLQNQLLEDSARIHSFFSKNQLATVFLSLDLKVLYFNHSSLNLNKIFLNQPLKIGKRFADIIKDPIHKERFIESTQSLVAKNNIIVEVNHLDQNYIITYEHIQRNETETPFISLSVSDNTKITDLKNENLILNTQKDNLKKQFIFFTITTLPNLNIISISPEFKTHTGNNISGITKKSLMDIMHSDSRLELETLLLNNDFSIKKTIETDLTFETVNANNLTCLTTISKVNLSNQEVLIFTCVTIDHYNEIATPFIPINISTSKEIIDNIPGFVYRSDIDGKRKVNFMSQGFEKLTGYSVDDIIDNNRLSLNDIVLPKYRKQISDKQQESLLNKTTYHSEHEIMTSTGTHQWVWEQGYYIYDEDENAVELQGFVIDINNLKNNTELYILEINSLKQYIDNASQGFLQIDDKTNIIRSNYSISNTLEYSMNSLKALTLNDLVHPNSLNTYTVFIKNLFDKKSATANLILTSKNKTNRHVTIEAKKYNNNEYILNITDNTKEIEEKDFLFLKYKSLNDILSNIDIQMFVFNYHNLAVEYSNNYLKNINTAKIFKTLGLDETTNTFFSNSILKKAIYLKISTSEIVEFVDNNNQSVKFKVILTPMLSIENVESLLIYLIDMTDYLNQKNQLEQKIKKLETTLTSKCNLYSNTIQGVRAPLNSIIGISESLLHNCDHSIKSQLTTIKNSSLETIDSINNILNLTNIESGKIDLIFEQFNAETLLNSLIQTYAPQCEDKGLIFIAQIQKELLNNIISDEILIRKTLSIILENTIRNTDSGYIKTAISLKNRDGNHWLDINITDTGIGLSSETKKSTYTPFSYFDTNLPQNVKIKEHELVICKNILEILNGNIIASSRVGIGTSINISIPIAFAESNNPNTIPDIFKKAKVLIATSNKEEMESIKSILSQANAETYTCVNSIEAIQLTTKKSEEKVFFDFLFIDYNVDGLTCAETIKTIKLIHDDISICILSKHSDIQNAIASFTHTPFIPVLSMPVLPTTLFNTAKSLNKRHIKGSNEINFTKLSKEILILIAEDNPVNMLMLKEILSMSEATILEAKDGQEAYVKFLSHQPDIIFMDIHMPNIDGFEATNLVRNHCNENEVFKTPHIIALTANNANNIRNKYSSFGMNDFISKPYKISDIQDSLSKFLKDEQTNHN